MLEILGDPRYKLIYSQRSFVSVQVSYLRYNDKNLLTK